MTVSHAKITIIGAGHVGSTTAYSLAMDNLGKEIILVNRDPKRAIAEALDIAHGTCSETPVRIHHGEIEETAGSDLIIFTAGAGPQPGESRLDMLQKNVDIVQRMIPRLVELSPDCILLIVSNPVDILTFVACKEAGLKKERVFGSGTVLDTARLRFFLRRKFALPMRYLHTLILGEHGDSQTIIWSQTTVGGIPIEDYLHATGKKITVEDKEALLNQVVKTGIEEIVYGKGYTNFGIAAAVKRIAKAILLNENAVLPVSVAAVGEYGIQDVCLSLPCLVGSLGIVKVLELNLAPEEVEKLKQSAALLKEHLNELNL